MAAIEQVLVPKSRYERLLEISQEHAKCKEEPPPSPEASETSGSLLEDQKPVETDPPEDIEESTSQQTTESNSQEESDKFNHRQLFQIKTLKDLKMPGVPVKVKKTVKRTIKKEPKKKDIVKKQPKKKDIVKWIKW